MAAGRPYEQPCRTRLWGVLQWLLTVVHLQQLGAEGPLRLVPRLLQLGRQRQRRQALPLAAALLKVEHPLQVRLVGLRSHHWLHRRSCCGLSVCGRQAADVCTGALSALADSAAVIAVVDAAPVTEAVTGTHRGACHVAMEQPRQGHDELAGAVLPC